MLFPSFTFGSKSRRSRSSPPEIVPLSSQHYLKPLSCQQPPSSRHSILVQDGVEIVLPEAPAQPRRVSSVGPRARSPSPHDDHVAEITYIYPSRGRSGERTERWVESRNYDSDYLEDLPSTSYRRPSASRQELVIDCPTRSRRSSCSPGPSVTSSLSSSPGRNSARSTTSSFSQRSQSTARSTLTASSRTSSTSRYRYLPYDDDDVSTKSYTRCIENRKLDEEEKKRLRRILKVAEYAAGRTRGR